MMLLGRLTDHEVRFIFGTPLENDGIEQPGPGLTPCGDRVSLLGCRSKRRVVGWAELKRRNRPLPVDRKSFRLIELAAAASRRKLEKEGLTGRPGGVRLKDFADGWRKRS